MLGCRMMVVVFLFLLVFDKWKSGKVIVVNFPMKVVDFKQSQESQHVCARMSCAAACDCVHIHRPIDSNSNYVCVYITLNLNAYVTMNSG
jgi:hypothetical protein